MNIREQLLTIHSKINSLKIAAYIRKNPKHFKDLIDLVYINEPIISQRASWVMSICMDEQPELFDNYIQTILIHFPYSNFHDSVKRHSLKVLQNINIPNNELGKLIDDCFNLIHSNSEAVAVKVYAMDFIFNNCKNEPDILNELKLEIENQLPYSSAGFKSKANKIIKYINKKR